MTVAREPLRSVVGSSSSFAANPYGTVGGDRSIEVAITLNNLAAAFQRKGELLEAERRFRRALAIKEKILGPEHPAIAPTLNNLAVVRRQQGEYSEAEAIYRRCFALLKGSVDRNHPYLLATVRNYEALLRERSSRLGLNR
jgi:tetratricopeptide (TPR) repeat protein